MYTKNLINVKNPSDKISLTLSESGDLVKLSVKGYFKDTVKLRDYKNHYNVEKIFLVNEVCRKSRKFTVNLRKSTYMYIADLVLNLTENTIEKCRFKMEIGEKIFKSLGNYEKNLKIFKKIRKTIDMKQNTC
jgi:hypothetical protein